MSWAAFHRKSESLAAEAHGALRQRDLGRANGLFARAAEAEAEALAYIGADKPRTLGITAVSAVALWYKAGRLKEAEELAHRASAIEEMPPFARGELRELIQAVWNEQAQRAAGVSFAAGQVVVSVKGGGVVPGGAPLDAVIDKVKGVEALFYRTAEFLKKMPLRKKGQPSRDLQARCRPWLFQSVPGSYQFSVTIQKPPQGEIFPTDDPEPEVLTTTFLSILRSASEDPGETLRSTVPNDEYRETLLKMARNLAPTGNVFNEIEIRGSGDRTPIVLSPQSRELMSQTLRSRAGEAIADRSAQEIVVHGILRALDLNHDWIEISVGGKVERVTGTGDVVDDLIGPMVNREVNVRARRDTRGTLSFIDIGQLE